jgi:hypothetical protein
VALLMKYRIWDWWDAAMVSRSEVANLGKELVDLILQGGDVVHHLLEFR